MTIEPLYINTTRGSIVCFQTSTGRIFRSCSASRCIYSADLHTAKTSLDRLEYCKRLKPDKTEQLPPQRKTTLKWTSDGELSGADDGRKIQKFQNMLVVTKTHWL